jgi:hypothetical protein
MADAAPPCFRIPGPAAVSIDRWCASAGVTQLEMVQRIFNHGFEFFEAAETTQLLEMTTRANLDAIRAMTEIHLNLRACLDAAGEPAELALCNGNLSRLETIRERLLDFKACLASIGVPPSPQPEGRKK